MKKVIMLLLICISLVGLVGCGYKPKYSDEFYENYVKNLESQNEMINDLNETYEQNVKTKSYELPLSNKDKKEIDEKIEKSFN